MEAHDPFDAVSADAGYLQPRLRPDLRIVYENDGTGRNTALIRIVDPVTGKQYSFTEQEHRLGQAADGQTSLRDIHARVQDSDGPALAPRDVIAFFRRLHILGLLGAGQAPDPAAAPQTKDSARPAERPAGRRGPRFPSSNPRRNTAPGDTAGPTALGPTALGPTTLGTAPEAAPETAPDTAPGTAPDTAAANAPLPAASADNAPVPVAPSSQPASPELVSPEPVFPEPGFPELAPAAPLDDSPVVPPQDAVPAPDKADDTPRTPAPGVKAVAQTAAQTAAQSAAPAAAVTTTPRRRQSRVGRATPTPAAAQPAPQPKPPASAPAASKASPPATSPAASALSDDPLAVIAGNLADPEPPSRNIFFDDDDETIFGALGGGMGGMGGGLGGGLGGGMGGMGARMNRMGGAAAGGANRERIMAAIAARKAGGQSMGQGMGQMGMGQMGMAGMFGAAPPAAEPPPAATNPVSLRLLDPSLLLRLLYILFYPLKLFLWLIVPGVVIAGLTMAQNWQELLLDRATFNTQHSALTLFVISLFVANITSRLAQGVAIIAHGGKVRSMGLMLSFGILPRFYVDTSAIAGLDRRGQLWAHAAPLLARLALFVAGIMTWAITHDSGSWLSSMGLIVGLFGLGMFLVSAFPLALSDGKNWIATYLNEPRIINKAVAALRHVTTGRPLPPFMDRSDLWPMVFFAMGTILTICGLVLGLMITAAIVLETELNGTGVTIFLAMVGSFVFWLFALKASLGRRMAAAMANRPGLAMLQGGAGAFPAGAQGAATPGGAMLGRVVDPAPNATFGVTPRPIARPAEEPAPPASATARIIWSLIAAGLLAVAFLPYEYEAGGQVDIRPAARAQAVARTSGEVVDILVTEGEMVTRGQLLAQLSSWDQENDVKVTRAMLDGAEANLARLRAGAKPEELELAMRQLDRAETGLAYSQAEAERAAELVASGTISQQAHEQAIAAYEADRAALDVAQANLDLVRSAATPEEIAIAAAEVARLAEELAFREAELTRTRIEAPMEGRIVTSDLELRHGAFLGVGETLVEIEDAATINATIAVPEADISLIAIGDAVRLRVWGQSNTEIAGTVRDIAPVATGTGYGNVVMVEASFPNPDGFLRSGMTGYAKIAGAEMQVWDAYLRSISRFLEIEVWSWIP